VFILNIFISLLS